MTKFDSVNAGMGFDWRLKRCSVLVAFGLLASSIASAADLPRGGVVHSLDVAKKTATIAVEQTYSVKGETAAVQLGKLNPGDIVQFDPPSDGTLTAETIQTRNRIVDVSIGLRGGAFIIALLLLLAPASACAGWHPLRYFVGVDCRTSNSQTQLVLWSATVLLVYLMTVLLRVWVGSDRSAEMVGGVEIPPNLLALSGLSGLTFAGARAVTASKNASAEQNNTGAGASNPAPEKTKSPVAAKIANLFEDDAGNLDFGDTQMIMITFIAIALYLVKSFFFLSQIELAPHVILPDIDTYLLASFGIGQGAYLAKKAASPPGKG